MSLLKHMKAAVLLGIAGVLVFAGGAFAGASVSVGAQTGTMAAGSTDAVSYTVTVDVTDGPTGSNFTAVTSTPSSASEFWVENLPTGVTAALGDISGTTGTLTLTSTAASSEATTSNLKLHIYDGTGNVDVVSAANFSLVVGPAAGGGDFTITYNSTGSTSGTAPAAQTGKAGTTVTLRGQGSLVKTNYSFIGWTTTSGGTTVDYYAGASLVLASNLALHPVWQATAVSSVAISSQSSDLTISTNAGTVKKNGVYTLKADVTATGGASENVRWTLAPNVPGETLQSGTKIDVTGGIAVLTVASAEEKVIKLTATSTFDANQSDNVVLTVDGSSSLTAGTTVVSAPVASSVTHTNIIVGAVSLSTTTPAHNQIPEYAIAKVSNASLSELSGWQTTTDFSTYNSNALEQGVTYYVYARAKQTTTFAAGATKVSSGIKTLVAYEAKDFMTAVPGTLTFSAAGAYTTPQRPGLTSPTLAGTIDSIYDVSVAIGGIPVANPVNNKTAGTVSFNLPAGENKVREITLRYSARGKTPSSAGASVWYTPQPLVWKVNIVRKPLDASNISVNAAVPVVYTGSAIIDDVLESKITVTDGAKTLSRGVDFELGGAGDYTGLNRMNAGTAYIVINGKGNYSGTKISKEYTIERAELSDVTLSISNGNKIYNGAAGIDTNAMMKNPAGGADISNNKARVTASFTSLVDQTTVTAFANVTDFVFDAAGTAFDRDSAGAPRTLSAKIALNWNASSRSNNYRFATGRGDTLTVKLPGLQIEKLGEHASTGVADFIANLADSIPTTHYFNNTIRGLGTPSFKEPIKTKNSAVNASLKYLYSYAAGARLYTSNSDTGRVTAIAVDTTLAPKEAGTYAVRVRVLDGGNNIHSATYLLGDYKINAPLTAEIKEDVQAAYSVREGRTVTLSVKAEAKNGGRLRYQWYKYGEAATDSTLLRGDTLSSLTVVAGKVGEFLKYRVKITNFFSGAGATQVSADILSGYATITVNDPPKSMSGGFVVINPDRVWTYTGAGIQPSGEDVKVYLRTRNEAGGYDTTELGASFYVLSYTKNIEVGTATVRATGVDEYDGVLSATFSILKKELARSDLIYTASRVYSGEALGADVKAIPPKTGMGAITVFYDGDTTKPANAGEYVVTANVAAGTNFTAATDVDMGVYTILAKRADSTDFTYSIPKNHNLENPPAAFGIGDVTLKGTLGGTVTVTYDNMEEVPTTAGSYVVRAELSGGQNYESGAAVLGTYVIKATPDAVKGSDREIPTKPVVEEAAVAPVKVVASGFTAGPSPVSKGGVIKFFSTKTVKSGSLYIFDKNGNSVAKLAATAGSGEIGKWTANVSEGTYVVKGALTGKDGTREKVSFVFVVVR